MLDVHALARGRAVVHALAVVAGRRRRPHVEGRLAVATAVGDVVDAHERELECLERGAARLAELPPDRRPLALGAGLDDVREAEARGRDLAADAELVELGARAARRELVEGVGHEVREDLVRGVHIDGRHRHFELGQADERLAARSDQVGVSAQFFIFDHGGEHRAMPVLRRELELWHFAEEASRAVPQVRADLGHTRVGDRRRRRRHGKLTRFPNLKKVGPKRSGSYDSMPSWTRRRVGPGLFATGLSNPVLF